MTKIIRWDAQKSEWLRKERGIGFEECVLMIEAGDVVDIIPHPKEQYAHQNMFVLAIDGYIHVIPFVENDDEIFLKTLYASREHQDIYFPKD